LEIKENVKKSNLSLSLLTFLAHLLKVQDNFHVPKSAILFQKCLLLAEGISGIILYFFTIFGKNLQQGSNHRPLRGCPMLYH
jgi:hypothetical protein